MEVINENNKKNEKLEIPKYARNAAFKALVKICENAGCNVEFTDNISYGITEADPDMRVIQMPISYEYKSEENAGAMLGHELAHILVDEFYVPDDKKNEYAKLFPNDLKENDCDKIGVALYKLAELTAEYEAEKIFRYKKSLA